MAIKVLPPHIASSPELSARFSCEARGNSLVRVIAAEAGWIAVAWIEAGRSEVYVSPADDIQRRVRVSAGSGEEPRWRADGRHAVYRYGQDWFEASFEPGSPPSVGTTVKLFTGPYANVAGANHSLFPDGSCLLPLDSGVDVTRRLRLMTGVEGVVDRAARGN